MPLSSAIFLWSAHCSFHVLLAICNRHLPYQNSHLRVQMRSESQSFRSDLSPNPAVPRQIGLMFRSVLFSCIYFIYVTSRIHIYLFYYNFFRRSERIFPTIHIPRHKNPPAHVWVCSLSCVVCCRWSSWFFWRESASFPYRMRSKLPVDRYPSQKNVVHGYRDSQHKHIIDQVCTDVSVRSHRS